MLGKFSNWKILSCFASWETIRQGETNCHKLESLVSVLVLGPSVHPKNARELTFQAFVDFMDTDWSSCSC
jgi:hypothetical protein